MGSSFESLVPCRKCRALLEVSDNDQLLKCGQCGQQWVVRRREGEVQLETLAEIDQQIKRLTREVAELSYREQIARIDREWEQERKKYTMHHDKEERKDPPSWRWFIVTAVFGALAGLVFFVFAIMAGPGTPRVGLVLAGLFVIIACLALAAWYRRTIRDYREALERYQQRRASVPAPTLLNQDERFPQE